MIIFSWKKIFCLFVITIHNAINKLLRQQTNIINPVCNSCHTEKLCRICIIWKHRLISELLPGIGELPRLAINYRKPIWSIRISQCGRPIESVSNRTACLRGYNLVRTDLCGIAGAEIYETGRTCVRQQSVDCLLRFQQDPSLVHPVTSDASGRTLE